MNIIKGVIYGVFSIIPGLSGGVVASYFGDYQKVINIIYDKNKVFDNVFYLLQLCIGVILGMIFASRIIIVVYYKIYMLFYLFIIFVNFILIVTKVKKTHFFNKFSITKIVLIILPLIIFIALKDFSFPAHNIYKYIIGSFVYSFSKIFPGVSSTSILINLGFYDEVMLFFSHPLSAFLNNWILWLFFWLSFMFFSLCFIKFIKYLINTDIFDDLLICVMVVNFILLLVNI